jgi:hypothetical protein
MRADTIFIDYLKGTLWVDEFVTHHQSLDNINKGFDDMHVSNSSSLNDMMACASVVALILILVLT